MATIDDLKDDEIECDPDAFDPLCRPSRGMCLGIALALPIWVLITACISLVLHFIR